MSTSGRPRAFALFAVASSIVSITTGIFPDYSYGITQMEPAAVWLWPVAAVGQLFVVLVLAELAGHVPLAGANYQWAARLVDARLGAFVALRDRLDPERRFGNAHLERALG